MRQLKQGDIHTLKDAQPLPLHNNTKEWSHGSAPFKIILQTSKAKTWKNLLGDALGHFFGRASTIYGIIIMTDKLDKASWASYLFANEQVTEKYADNIASQSDTIVRYIRGRRAQDYQHTLQEFAAALQFPYYFGENWSALNDCLTDLMWLPGKHYMIVVTQADLLLEKETRGFNTLLSILADVHDFWVGQGKNFSVIFQSEEQYKNMLRKRFVEAGHDLPLIVSNLAQ